ncbi:Putative glutamine amidotransferase [Pandoraea capi]|uniref:Glutamine amidotransferase n=1 Tax=Pandoraea capi TaxID=2508286 RepID=A0ABY6W5E4_9BURK|nr:gamma-glutamyl-gamma-aminobutyrate hydrolase family protein [Pandoraea capi]VVE19504.1 Putative glutamine amidotransferase [Pandoraea capi]
MPSHLTLNTTPARTTADAETPAQPPKASSTPAQPAPPAAEQTLNLTPLQMKAFKKGLSFRERQTLLTQNPDEQATQALKGKISAARAAPINLTRPVDRRSALRHAADAIGHFSARSAKNIVRSRVSDKLAEPAPGDHGAALPSVNKVQLEKLIAKAKAADGDAPVDVAAQLRAAGFSTRISNLTLSDSTLLKHAKLDGLSFVNCHFDWSHFGTASLSGTRFAGCRLNNASFMKASLDNCIFEDCIMRETMMTGSSLHAVTFQRCDIVSGSFEDTHITDSRFDTVTLAGTHFLDANVARSSIHNSHLTNAAFFGTLPNFEVDDASRDTAVTTKPLAAILINPEVRGVTVPKVFMKLDQAANNVPLRITMQPQSTELTAINREMDTALGTVGEYTPHDLPIGQRLLREIDDHPDAHPQLSSIVAKAQKLGEHVNAIVLPGGEDVPPALYGAAQDPKTNWGGDYRRSALELALIRESTNKGIPMLAVCRGFQMANVYFGAQMQQHVEGHKGLQRFKLTEESRNGLYGEAMRKSILSTVAHHQAIPVSMQAPAGSLKPSVVYKDLVKAVEGAHSGAAPAVMLQFHPEFYRATTAATLLTELADLGQNITMSSTNNDFWKILSDASDAHRTKKTVLEDLKQPQTLRPVTTSAT